MNRPRRWFYRAKQHHVPECLYGKAPASSLLTRSTRAGRHRPAHAPAEAHRVARASMLRNIHHGEPPRGPDSAEVDTCTHTVGAPQRGQNERSRVDRYPDSRPLKRRRGSGQRQPHTSHRSRRQCSNARSCPGQADNGRIQTLLASENHATRVTPTSRRSAESRCDPGTSEGCPSSKMPH